MCREGDLPPPRKLSQSDAESAQSEGADEMRKSLFYRSADHRDSQRAGGWFADGGAGPEVRPEPCIIQAAQPARRHDRAGKRQYPATQVGEQRTNLQTVAMNEGPAGAGHLP